MDIYLKTKFNIGDLVYRVYQIDDIIWEECPECGGTTYIQLYSKNIKGELKEDGKKTCMVCERGSYAGKTGMVGKRNGYKWVVPKRKMEIIRIEPTQTSDGQQIRYELLDEGKDKKDPEVGWMYSYAQEDTLYSTLDEAVEVCIIRSGKKKYTRKDVII